MRFEAQGSIARHGLARPAAVALGGLLFVVYAASAGFGLASSALTLVLVTTIVMTMLGKPKKRPGTVHTIAGDASGLVVDDELVMARRDIVRARSAKADGNGVIVYLEGGVTRRSAAVFLETDEEAHALMDALQLGSSHTTAHFKALPPWAKHVRWLAVFLTTTPWLLLNVVRFLPAWFLALIGLGYGLVILPTLLPQHVEVGQDGIFLKWLGKRRFIPFTMIEDARGTPFGVALTLRSGKKVEIRLTQKNEGAVMDRHALLERIYAALELGERTKGAEEEAFLAKGSRDVETWVREMNALGSGDGGYRANAIPRERLWEIVENPSANPSAREGAAIALHASLDDDERDRLVALAHKTASPRLRVALDGVSRERDGARLRVALEAADEEVDEPTEDDARRGQTATMR